MNHTTTANRLSIIRAAHVAADLVGALVRVEGLPEPGSITTRIDYSLDRGHYEAVSLMFYRDSGFDDVRKWARALKVETTGHINEDGVEFIDADVEHRGVIVNLTANRQAVGR